MNSRYLREKKKNNNAPFEKSEVKGARRINKHARRALAYRSRRCNPSRSLNLQRLYAAGKRCHQISRPALSSKGNEGEGQKRNVNISTPGEEIFIYTKFLRHLDSGLSQAVKVTSIRSRRGEATDYRFNILRASAQIQHDGRAILARETAEKFIRREYRRAIASLHNYSPKLLLAGGYKYRRSSKIRERRHLLPLSELGTIFLLK